MAVIMEVIRTFSIGGKWKKLIGDGDGLQEIIEIGIESKETGGIGSGRCKLVERKSCVTLGCCG
jgi:hypothetical protein